jgi:hypothetical protein
VFVLWIACGVAAAFIGVALALAVVADDTAHPWWVPLACATVGCGIGGLICWAANKLWRGPHPTLR